MKRCVIIGGSEIKNYEWVKNHILDGDYCIYCDSGLYHLEELGAEPSLIIGDFDSHPEPHMDAETIKLPTEKDDTDTVYAVKEAIKRGYRDFVLVGVLGKRFDHTLGNLSILLMLHRENCSGVIVDDYSEIRVISAKDGVVKVDDDCKYFSLLCAGGDAGGISIRNAKYSLEGADLTMEFPLGVSNEVLPGKKAEISVKEGRLFLIKIVDKNA
jgi:thiamine pyrophosphokinase